LGISLALKSNQTKRENNEIEENKSIKKKTKQKTYSNQKNEN
jgi:hypothetical protein